MMRAEITNLPMFDEYAFIEQHGRELTSDELEVLSERKALHIHDGHVARVVPVQLPRNLVTLLLNMLRVGVENEQDVLHTVLLQYGAEPKCANVDDRQRLGVSSRNELDPIQTICPVLNKPQLPRQDNCEL